MQSEEDGVLETLGVSEQEERIYRSLLRQPAVRASELKALTGLSTPGVKRALVHLEELGLLRPSPGTELGFVPVAPDLALSALVNSLRSQLDRVQGAAAEFAEEFRLSQQERHPSELIEVIAGQGEMTSRALAVTEGATTELLFLTDPPPYVVPVRLEEEVDRESPLLARGVKIRVVYSQAALARPGRMEVVAELASKGEEARVFPDLPIRLLIADRRVAIVPLTSQRRVTTSAALVHPSDLLHALIALFESTWNQAIPLPAWRAENPPLGTLTAQQQQAMMLLAAGAKDEAIARHLGVSLRTARRRITELMGELHTATRFQAGAQAARRGWL
jgi:sugar-specific transcriptional regulator TrmB/DNA-binding CsgD family transcriptional regulator